MLNTLHKSQYCNNTKTNRHQDKNLQTPFEIWKKTYYTKTKKNKKDRQCKTESVFHYKQKFADWQNTIYN